MSKIETRLIGTTLSTSAVFKNVSNVIFAPTTVNLKYKKPGALSVTSTTVSPDIANKYTTTVLLDTVGVWYFRWEAVDANSVADEFSITVTDTSVK